MCYWRKSKGMVSLLAITLSIFLYSSVSFSAEPEILKDINQLGDSDSNSQREFHHLNGITYFLADDGIHGEELWKSDGTTDGTMMVKDITEGVSGSFNSGLDHITHIGNTLYFIVWNNKGQFGLWKSDGTSGGTVIVKDFGNTPYNLHFFAQLNDLLFLEIIEGNDTFLWISDGTSNGTVPLKSITLYTPSTSNPTILSNIVINGTLFFSGDNGNGGTELWKSDGSIDGTVMVKDINITGNSNPTNFVNVNGTLYFTVDYENGESVWKSDGTELGTVMVKKTKTYLEPMVSIKDSLYFVVSDPVEGKQLWKTKGTEASTILVQDKISSVSTHEDHQLTVFDDNLYFVAHNDIDGWQLWKTEEATGNTFMLTNGNPSLNYWPNIVTAMNAELFFTYSDTTNNPELWKTDGTVKGTRIVRDINIEGDSDVSNFCIMNNTLLFTATKNKILGKELWKSDGTFEGTVLVKDINPYGDLSISENHNFSIKNINNEIYFSATDGVHGYEVWKSDGTFDGTRMLKDINQTGDGDVPQELIKLNNFLYFFAKDKLHGIELWKSNGNSNGTQMVKDIFNGPVSSNLFTPMMTLKNELFFSAEDPVNGTGLWKSDGTAEGTLILKGIHVETHDGYWNINNELIFVASDATGDENLYKTDGSKDGTQIIKDINEGGKSYLDQFTKVDNILYFTADDGVHGVELWKSDGTNEGTILVKDIQPGLSNSYPRGLMAMNGMVYFSADDGTNDVELWKSDGSEQGTIMVKDIIQNGSSHAWPLSVLNDKLFFFTTGGASIKQLWISDGNEESTKLLKDINVLNSFEVINNKALFLVLDDVGTSVSILASDGTIEGTKLLLEFGLIGVVRDFTKTQEFVFFSAWDNKNGEELWKTDGTIEGTLQVHDINPGEKSSSPRNLANINGEIYFSANDGIHGEELWKSDGTKDGTIMVAEVNKGIEGSMPSSFVEMNNYLYFTAKDQNRGEEIWRLSILSDNKDENKNEPDSNSDNSCFINTLFFN